MVGRAGDRDEPSRPTGRGRLAARPQAPAPPGGPGVRARGSVGTPAAHEALDALARSEALPRSRWAAAERRRKAPRIP